MVTRRRVLRTGLVTAAAAVGSAAALWPMLVAGRPRTATASGGAPGSGTGTVDLSDDTAPVLFDEVYRGRHITGFASSDPACLRILVDGRPLEVMRRVDGSWISMANHYQPFPAPLATARGAVDVLGRAELSPATDPHPH